MKSFLSIVFLLVCSPLLRAQQRNDVIIGSIDSINSSILKEQRKIWVHVPPSFRSQNSDAKKYPVIYLLDAEKNYTGVVGMVDLLSSMNGNDLFPEMIIVGIPNTNRTRDLTPTQVTNGLWIDSYTASVSGGGEAFISFIEKELIPHIDSLFPTTPYRTLIGHSYGGLTVMNTIVHHKNIFNAYIAIDPSMWWDKQRLLHEAEQVLKKDHYENTTLFLAMANTLPPGIDTTTVQKDTSDGTLHPRSILSLSRYVLNNRQNGIQSGFNYYKEDTHGSIPLIATYDALHFIFNDYAMKIEDGYFIDPEFKLADFIEKHFKHISWKYGFTDKNGGPLSPPEDLLYNLGYFVSTKKQFSKAEDLYKMNIKYHPESANVYDHLGDLYSEEGDLSHAKANYKKALSLKEIPETRQKMEKLGKK
ncbi:MAG: alpha/beta hydrolase-fold protein [Chitinophagaceae bacterium]